MEKWTRILYHPHLPLTEEGPVTLSQKHIDLSCEAAQEGMVLLKNNGALPLTKGAPIALLGKGTFDYVKGGGGSGDVHPRYIRNIYDGVKHLQAAPVFEPLADYYHAWVQSQYDLGIAPGMLAEPDLPDELLTQAAAFADTAVISISRFSGEGWDRPCGIPCGEQDPWQGTPVEHRIDKGVFMGGDFSLTAAERAMVDKALNAFGTVIVLLNVGGVVDTAWIKEDEGVSAALLAWQGGMEGGLAAARLLYGDANPCGKLPDTFPVHISDYPSTACFHENNKYVHYTEDVYVGYRYFETLPGKAERVCYPFGYGLSYTTFALRYGDMSADEAALTFRVRVENTDSVPGKEVVQLYCAAPQGKLGKPARVLAGFQKTRLLAPGEAEDVTITCPLARLASYDDLGKVCKSAYVLEKGDYVFLCGTSVRDAQPVHTLTLTEDQVVEQLSAKLVPTSLPQRLLADGSYEALPTAPAHDLDESVVPDKQKTTYCGSSPQARAVPRQMHGDHSRKQLRDVLNGRVTLDDFIAQLSDDDLFSLLGGQPNQGVANTCGIGNLPEYGVPSAMTADGPAGVRIEPHTGVRTTAFPCGTLLASTWAPALVERVGAAGGAELKENNLAMWLTPAVNIHRNPLCGRNFEYYAEDPLLAGTTGAAMVRGIQSNGVSACVKHFACNNKETDRVESDSRLSERALREIYLKTFEIIIKTGKPKGLMTAYNAINGRRTSESRELLTDILRGEWGYDGLVVTDWWNHGEHYKELLAGNDIKMATGYPERLQAAMDKGAISRDDLVRSARRVLEFLMKLD